MAQSIELKRTADEADMEAEAGDTRCKYLRRSLRAVLTTIAPLQRQLETWLGGFPFPEQHKTALMLLDVCVYTWNIGTVRLT